MIRENIARSESLVTMASQIKQLHMNFLRVIIIAFVMLTLIRHTAAGQEKKILHISSLQKNVEILRDQWGINHIYARNQHDLFFAQGYCAAKDRLFQLEIWRRQATGTVAEILGQRELKRDIGTRLFRFRGDMNSELQHYHPQGASIIQAYVDGVNEYIAEISKSPEQLPVEFQLLHIQPGRWTPEVVISRHQGILGNVTRELDIGRAVAKAGVDQVKDLMWFHPGDPLLTLDSSINSELLSKNILGPYTDFHKDIVFEKQDIDTSAPAPATGLSFLNRQLHSPETAPADEPDGSNNWIVSGSRTASGYAMLANDPHRQITVPSLRYMVHLVAPGWNVIGGGEPEIPGVSIGHNEEGAWGLTIHETDGEDLYVYDLNPSDLTQYKYKGSWLKMKEINETITVKNATAQVITLRYTLHGPVTFIDTLHHKGYAVKCAWLEPGGAPYLASLRIDQAKTWESFREACSYNHIPGENMIWADRKGNTGWQVVGIAPIRKNFSGLVPVPGDGRFEWSGYLPIKERPNLLNPPKGFLATANQQVTPADYTHRDAVGYTWGDAFRGDRINEVLQGNNHITIKQMEALQTDYFSIPARSLVPLLKPVFFSDSSLSQAKQMLMNWNFVLDKTSVAAGIYAMWEQQLILLANKEWVPDELKPWIKLQMTKIIERLQHPEPTFKNDAISKRDAFLKMSFENTLKALTLKLGPSSASWIYGQDSYKHITMTHQLSLIVTTAMKQHLNIGPLPRGGNAYTPGATGGLDNQVHGASFRLIVDVGDWDKAVMINTPGQSGDPKSRFYKNLFPLWAKDQYFPAYYSKAKIEKTVIEKLELVPSK